MIDDILGGDTAENSLRATARLEFAKRELEEKSWPQTTDCDRLDAVFQALTAQGILALSNAGETIAEGRDIVAKVLKERGREGYSGYCFCRGENLEWVVRGGRLIIAFGDLAENDVATVEIGKRVVAAIERAGFKVDWPGNPNVCITIPKFDWKRRRRTV